MPLALADLVEQLWAARALGASLLARAAGWLSAHTGVPVALAAAAVLVAARRLVGAGLRIALEVALVTAVAAALAQAGWLSLEPSRPPAPPARAALAPPPHGR